MRNLNILSTFTLELPSTLVGGRLSATAVDVDNKVLYGTVERITADGELEVAVWKFEVQLQLFFCTFRCC